MKHFDTVIDETELATMICCLRDSSSRLEKSLLEEARKHQPDKDELLFLTTEYSKVNFLLRKYETISHENHLNI